MDSVFDGDEVLRHLKLLNHDATFITHVQKEQCNQSPPLWFGFYRTNYNHLILSEPDDAVAHTTKERDSAEDR